MICASAHYRNGKYAKFNFDYYRDTHFPMVMALLKPYGAIRYEIERGMEMADGTTSEFIAIGSVYFNDLNGLHAAMAEQGEKIFNDVHNYTNVLPIIQLSEIL